MKFTYFLFLALIALVAVQGREVRSYTNEMEYVDHVDVHDAAQSEEMPISEGDHAMMETSAEEPQHSEDEHGMHFFMESAEEFDNEAPSFLETEAEDVDTDVMRAMALEIHDAAQENIDQDGDVQMLIELAPEEDPYFGLSPAEIAQAKADEAASKADKAAEAKEKKEEAADKAQAKKDAAVLAAPAPAPAAPKDVVQLPPDLSAEHAETLRANQAATNTIKGALSEMSAILVSKDDTIKSLVFNISYLTVGIGKLATKVDAQKAYIEQLQKKLDLANSKNRELRRHVAHTKRTTKSIRAQLAAVESRLSAQEGKANELKSYLQSKQDNIQLPTLEDNLEVRGTPITKRVRRVRRLQTRSAPVGSARLHPVEGTQTYADAHTVFVPAQPTFIPAGQFFTNIPTPLTHPTFDGIPTIVVERSDDGN